MCVPFFRLFCSYLVLSATLPYSHTYTQQQITIPRAISSLPSVVLTHGLTHGSPFPGCLLYVQLTACLSVIFFSAACLITVRVHVTPSVIYLHHGRKIICSPHPVSILYYVNTCSAAVLLYRIVYTRCRVVLGDFTSIPQAFVPHADSMAPTESFTERYRSSSHPDRCLYAMLAFIVGYALFRMLCRRSCAFRFFDFFARTWSCLLLIVGHHCCTRKPGTKSVP